MVSVLKLDGAFLRKLGDSRALGVELLELCDGPEVKTVYLVTVLSTGLLPIRMAIGFRSCHLRSLGPLSTIFQLYFQAARQRQALKATWARVGVPKKRFADQTIGVWSQATKLLGKLIGFKSSKLERDIQVQGNSTIKIPIIHQGAVWILDLALDTGHTMIGRTVVVFQLVAALQRKFPFTAFVYAWIAMLLFYMIYYIYMALYTTTSVRGNVTLLGSLNIVSASM